MIEFSVTGIEKTVKSFLKFEREGQQEFSKVTQLNARDIEGNAKGLVKKDFGKLGQSIAALEIDELNWKIVVHAKYGPYVEFGTGKMVQVPQELVDMAIRFKGKGVREVNLPARPYLYPSFVKGRNRYVKDLAQALEILTQKNK